MTITVDVKPEVQAELARQAAAHGRAIEAYVASLIEEAVHLPAETANNGGSQGRQHGKSLVEVCAMVRGLADDVDFSRDPSTSRPIDLS